MDGATEHGGRVSDERQHEEEEDQPESYVANKAWRDDGTGKRDMRCNVLQGQKRIFQTKGLFFVVVGREGFKAHRYLYRFPFGAIEFL